MYYLDYAKKVGERYILNFFADTIQDLANVPTNEPYITRNGFNYGIPLDSSVVTIVENGAQKNYVLQNGAYVAGGDIPSVLGTLEATENKTYKASDENLEGYSTVTVNVKPKLQSKSVTVVFRRLRLMFPLQLQNYKLKQQQQMALLNQMLLMMVCRK